MREPPLKNLDNTLFSLQTTSTKWRLIVAVVCSLLLVLTMLWGLLGNLPLLVAGEAIVGSNRNIQVVAVAADGKVIENGLAIAQLVEKGDVLIRLDSELATQQLADARKSLSSTKIRLEAARARKAALNVEIEKTTILQRGEKQEIAAQAAEKRLAMRSAKQHLKRLRELGEHASPQEIMAAKEAYDTASVVHRAWSARAQQGPQVTTGLMREFEQRIFEYSQEITQLESQLVAAETALQQAQRALEERVVRAPIAGQILQVFAPSVGGTIMKGEQVAKIEPADFDAIVAKVPVVRSGKVRPGQRAWLEIDGYPPFRHGRLPCRVEKILKSSGMESVEVFLVPDPKSADYDAAYEQFLTKGNTGDVYIEVERVTPLEMMLEQS